MMHRKAHSRISVPAACRPGGFTLIEVLVVTAILALLIAVFLPSLALARQQARRMACASNLRAVGQALNLYKSELGRYPSPGDRDPGGMFGKSWHPGDPQTFRPVTSLADIGDLAEALVYTSLGDPWALYCPSSLKDDRHAPKPYLRTNSNGRPIATWRIGNISYVYLVGLNYQQPASTFPDPQGQPTFHPPTESPERRINRVNPRAVLIGDRTVELVPPNRNIAESNHGREGGWFFFTTGDVQWGGWNRLAVHPTNIYLWYWPRTGRPLPVADPPGVSF
jgi:prepilin-type N-terminal cleavage/methylation domain-containing protein